MKSKIFLFLAIGSVAGMLAMSGCHRDDDEGNGRNGRTTGTLSGHAWVDLGLPSGTKWATCNVGANSPEEYGDYFAWGETTAKESYQWSTYRYCNGSYNTLTKYCNNSSYGYNGFTDNLTTLEASDDAATANWGAGWRMPTYAEVVELITYCPKTWTTQNLVPGCLFTGPNGNSIFFPFAGIHTIDDYYYDGYHSDGDSYLDGAGKEGYYWMNSLKANTYACAEDFGFSRDLLSYNDGSERIRGESVRPVCNR